MGGLPCLPPANRAFLLLSCPYPPLPPPFPAGRGEIFSLFRRGLSPRHPGIKPFAALTESAERVPCAWEPAVRRKTERTAFLWAVPAAKERGDRGRGTSAFEMVLSPGAGRTSAAGVQSPRRAPQRQGQPVTNRTSPRRARGSPPVPVPLPVQSRGCKGRSPLHKKAKKSPPSRREGGGGIGGKKVNQRQGLQAASKASPPAGTTAARSAGNQPGQASAKTTATYNIPPIP